MRIRRAELGEIEDVAALAVQLFPDRDVDEVFSDLILALTGRSAIVWLAEEDGQPIGYALCRLHHEDVKGTESKPVGYLEAVYVLPEHRRQGIGRRLVQVCETWTKDKKDCTELASDCRVTAPEALAFLTKLGFIEVDRIVCVNKRL